MEISFSHFYIGDKVQHSDSSPHKMSGSVSNIEEDKVFVSWFDGYGEWEYSQELQRVN